MGYRYNPNDQRFYDQLAQVSGIERRKVGDQRYRDEERLKNERAFLQAMENLPNVYHKQFANKRERTPLKYGEEGAGLTDPALSSVPPTDNLVMQDKANKVDKTVNNFGEQDIGAISPSPAVSPPADNLVMQDKQRMTDARNYSPGYSAVLDGSANPGYNPPRPIINPFQGDGPRQSYSSTPTSGSRWDEQEAWMNSPEGQMAKRQMPSADFLPYATEEQKAEIEKKKETPVQEIDVRASAPAPVPTPAPVAPVSEETKTHKDPRVSFRRFKADEFLQNNAVFQMDLPKIQPTYATMLNAEMQLAKADKDPNSRKEWEVLKDLETEEGQAPLFNAYTGQSKPSGLKQRPKSAAAGMPRKISEGDNSVLMQMPDGTTQEIPFKPKQGARFPILVPNGEGGSTLVYPDNQFVPGPPTKKEPPPKADRPNTSKSKIMKDGKEVEVLIDDNTGDEIKVIGEVPKKISPAHEKNLMSKRAAINNLRSTLSSLDRIENNYQAFKAKGHSPGALGTKLRGKAGEYNSQWAGIQKQIEDDEKSISLKDFMETARGMVTAMNTQKEGERFDKSILNIRDISPEIYEARLAEKRQIAQQMLNQLTKELEEEAAGKRVVNDSGQYEGAAQTPPKSGLSAAERARKILEGKK